MKIHLKNNTLPTFSYCGIYLGDNDRKYVSDPLKCTCKSCLYNYISKEEKALKKIILETSERKRDLREVESAWHELHDDEPPF